MSGLRWSDNTLTAIGGGGINFLSSKPPLAWNEEKLIIRINKCEKSEFVPQKLLFYNKDRNLFMFAFI